jgi:hypothetical protein
MEHIGCAAHKRCTEVSVEGEDGSRPCEGRVLHTRGALRQFLETRECDSLAATETIGLCHCRVIDLVGQK